MFEPDLYRKACSEGMRLSGEKIEEMIFMTENKKRALRKPMQIGLIAAALAVVMCVTAAAANPGAVQKLWESLAMSVVTVRDDGDTMVVQADVPEVSVDEADDRTVLTIDGHAADITDALVRDGQYVGTWENGDGTGAITVHADKTWEVEFTTADGATVRYDSNDRHEVVYTEEFGEVVRDGDTYVFTDDETRTDATYLPPEE